MNKSDILKQFPPLRENVLLILHSLQNSNPQNYLSAKDLTVTADYLNTTRGVIYGITSYYSMFSLKPRGRYIIRICDSPVCHLFETLNLPGRLAADLQIEPGQTTADGLFTLEFTACIGCCDRAPAMMINTEMFGNLTGPKIASLLQGLRKKAQ